MPHSRELGPESLKVPCMDLQLCGLQVVACVCDLLVDVLPVVVCPGGGTVLVVVSWWYHMEVGTCTLRG
ncbi:hypothetical protein Taro_013897 [Colocasia esculenta]|uniref:Uncharacterized protein n=1 Tax=Colocasia esculenta TaxID=4460 RepID=A0A843UK51_COLES|nr:hypothetical protein [Colocasia esculenta]